MKKGLAALLLTGMFVPKADALNKVIIPIIAKDSVGIMEFYDNSKGDSKNFQLGLKAISKRSKNFYFLSGFGFGMNYGKEKNYYTINIDMSQIKQQISNAENSDYEIQIPKELQDKVQVPTDYKGQIRTACAEANRKIENVRESYSIGYETPRMNLNFSLYMGFICKF